MDRVAVVGPGGAGKTTFATELGRILGLPVVYLDRHHWRPGWVEPANDVWDAQQLELVAPERWVIEGNYGRTFELRFTRADTVVVLMPPRLVCVAGAVRRTLSHYGHAVQAEGCPERFDLKFLRWIWRYRSYSRPRLDAALALHPHLTVVELRSRGEARRWLAALDQQDAKATMSDKLGR